MRNFAKNILLALLFLALSVFIAVLLYIHFWGPDDRNLSGEWTTELNMTTQAAVTAFIWLQDIEAVSVSLEDMEACMQNLTITVNMTMEQTGQVEGTFRCNINPESYDACTQAAYEAYATAFRKLLAERLDMAGYTGGTDEETVEALVTETFGMSTVSYLKSCAPALLPPLEELQAVYDGSGTYKTEEGILVRQFDEKEADAEKAEYYIRKDSYLILSGEVETEISDSDQYPVIYTLRPSQ